MKTFTELPLSAALQQKLAAADFITPTPVQAQAIPPALEGKDVLGTAQTGTGKTAAFVLPILSQLFKSGGSSHARGIRWLILAPTRELVVQIEENAQIYAKYLPARIATVIGGVSERPQIKALRSGADLVIATPGRLLDLLGQGHGDFSTLRFGTRQSARFLEQLGSSTRTARNS